MMRLLRLTCLGGWLSESWCARLLRQQQRCAKTGLSRSHWTHTRGLNVSSLLCSALLTAHSAQLLPPSIRDKHQLSCLSLSLSLSAFHTYYSNNSSRCDVISTSLSLFLFFSFSLSSSLATGSHGWRGRLPLQVFKLCYSV